MHWSAATTGAESALSTRVWNIMNRLLSISKWLVCGFRDCLLMNTRFSCMLSYAVIEIAGARLKVIMADDENKGPQVDGVWIMWKAFTLARISYIMDVKLKKGAAIQSTHFMYFATGRRRQKGICINLHNVNFSQQTTSRFRIKARNVSQFQSLNKSRGSILQIRTNDTGDLLSVAK